MTMELKSVDSRGRAMVRISNRVRKVIFEDFDPSELSDYDLFRGVVPVPHGQRGKNAIPDMVPRALYEEMVRRQMKRVDQEFAASVAKAVERLAQIATDPNVDESIQLRAISELLDRVYGKATQKSQVEIGGITSDENPMARMIEAVTIHRQDIVATDTPNIVDAEVLPDDEFADMDWDD